MYHFQEDASKIENKPFSFDQFSEFSKDMNEQHLIQYIMGEMNRFRQERIEDVSCFYITCTNIKSCICS